MRLSANPSEIEFAEIFKYNYGTHSKTLEKKHLTPFYIKKFWEIYCNNRYNIGNTIAQVKYVLSIPDISYSCACMYRYVHAHTHIHTHTHA